MYYLVTVHSVTDGQVTIWCQ